MSELLQQGLLAVEDVTAELSAGEAMAIAAHELRTPLATLRLQADSLQRSLSENSLEAVRAIERLATMRRQIARLDELSDTLLDASRIIEGKLALVRSDVDLAGLVREVLAAHGQDFARASCAVTLELEAGVRGTWDRQRLERVIGHLFDYAMKSGAGRPVSVTLRCDGAVARLCVTDGGSGVAGQGLGLWISRHFITGLGGCLRRDGATSIIELPWQSGG